MAKKISINSFLFFCWNVVVLLATLLPGSVINEYSRFSFPDIDLLIHTVIFGVYAFLLSGFLSNAINRTPGSWIDLMVITGITVLFSIIIEVIQQFIPGRNFEIIDIFFNFIGALAGFLIYRLKNIFFTR